MNLRDFLLIHFNQKTFTTILEKLQKIWSSNTKTSKVVDLAQVEDPNDKENLEGENLLKYRSNRGSLFALIKSGINKWITLNIYNSR